MWRKPASPGPYSRPTCRQTSERVIAGEITEARASAFEQHFGSRFVGTRHDGGPRLFPMIDVMNRYFDCMAEAVVGRRRDPNRGDAMLVVFRMTDECDAPKWHVRSSSSASSTQKPAGAVGFSRSKRRIPASQFPHIGCCLRQHRASSRLDFTVMGHSVNWWRGFMGGRGHERAVARLQRSSAAPRWPRRIDRVLPPQGSA